MTQALINKRRGEAPKPGSDIFVIHYTPGTAWKATPLQGNTQDAFGNFSSCWCLVDQPMLNHDLYKLWFNFADSVRIVVLSDSCHSGSRDQGLHRTGTCNATWPRPVVATREHPAAAAPHPDPARAIPPRAQAQIISAAHADFFKTANQRIAATRSLAAEPEPSAAVLLLAGCLDDQTSGDMPENGLFTGSVLQVWADGAFQGNYAGFLDQVKQATSNASGGAQTPRLFPVGEARSPLTTSFRIARSR